MSTVWIIVIVVAAVVLLVLLFAVVRRRGRIERKREQAGELREEARSRAMSAEQARLTADEHAERAERERRAAAEAEARARDVDPAITE
jgi:predicted Holliday junction resolvase-like endonuclease